MKYAIAENEEMLCLNIFVHIVRNTDGSGGLQSYQVEDVLGILNSDFNNSNIMFYKLGVDFIDNSIYYFIEGSERETIFDLNNYNNAINLYIVGGAEGFNGFSQHIPGRNLILTQSSVFSSVTSHEMGHCLNLFHTHHGHHSYEPPSPSDPLACEELLDGSNSSICGDYIPDTPADPGLRSKTNSSIYYVDQNCDYLNYANGYTPDTRNIMSYTKPDCLFHFTNDQSIRMRDAILNSTLLQSLLSCSCYSTLLLLGPGTIFSTENATYKLSCSSNGDAVSWTVSNNIQIINSNINSVAVKAINASINGQALIQATINGTSIYKEIWIGKPKFYIQLSPNYNFVDLTIIGLNSDINKQNLNGIIWEKTSGNGYMGLAPNQFENLAHGYGLNWYVEANIKASNRCGTTSKLLTISPPPPQDNHIFSLRETSKGIFQTISLISPIEEQVSSSQVNYKLIENSQLINAALYDLYMNKIKNFTVNYFDLRFLNPGIYILRVEIKETLLSKKIMIL